MKLKPLTPLQKKRLIDSNKKELEETSLSYYIGNLVAEQITDKLPNLETDIIISDNVYKVTEEEKEKLNSFKDDDQWPKLVAYRRSLAKKYLPKEITLLATAVPIGNQEEFKKGIANALWHCDHSWYSTKIENIDVSYDEYYMWLEITLKLSPEE